MRKISEFFIENYKLTLVLSIGIAIFGIQGLMRMNSESFPQVNFAMANIITSYDGATAEDIETKITRPIEEEVRKVSGIKDMRSISQAGLSSIYVRADIDNIDVEKVMADLQKAVDRVSGLPPDLREKPNFLEIKSEEFPVIELALTGDNTNRYRDRAADLLKEEIEDNSLVKDVRLVGFAKRRFNVRLMHKKLNQYHIGIDEVISKINGRNVSVPGGSIKETKNQELLRIEGKILNSEELENIIVRSNFTGEKIYLKDIATVDDSEEDLLVRTRYNGEEATILIVSKKGGADTIKLVNEINKKLRQFDQKHNGKVKYQIYHNESKKVINRLEVLSSNAVSGLVLVVVFLFLFLPGRIGIMASLSLPISVLATIGYMSKSGMNLNAITILALVIALGMLVDNSVVIAENFARLRQEGKDPKTAALDSISLLWLPITGTALTTIAAFLPMLVTKGIMGQFIRFIPIVVSVSLLLSLVESFILLPMRLAIYGGKNKTSEVKKEHWFEKFQIKFENFMRKAIKRKYVVGGIMTFLIVFSGFLMIKVNKFNLFPAEQTEIYIARLEMPSGTRLEKTSEVIGKISSDIKTVLGDDVHHLVGRAGTSKVSPTDPKAQDGNHVGMISIYVSDNAKFNYKHTEVLERLRTIKNTDVKELTFDALINGPPVGYSIEATFRSNNQVELEGAINHVMQELGKVNGIRDLRIDDVIGDDEIKVKVDYELVDRLGLNLQMIGNTIRSAVSGKAISNVNLNNKEVDIFIQLQENDRSSIDLIDDLMVMDTKGNLLPVKQFSHFEKKSGRPQIKRYDFKRSKTLTGNIDEKVITAVLANKKLKDIFESLSTEYPTVSLIFGGVAESTKESMQSLGDALILSLLGIFALLVFLFKSYLRPAIIMTTIPLGLLGMSVAFLIHGRPISFLSLIGLIGLGGIIVNSGIVLISFIDEMRSAGVDNLESILSKASGLRLKAVIVTSLTTISGLIPTAYGIGGSDSMLIPMTMAMAWGLTSGTILTLIWVPCAYAIIEDISLVASRMKEFCLLKFHRNDQEARSER